MSKDKDDDKGGGIDKALATALKQAKSKTMHAAVVVKTGTEGALLVSKRKIPPAAIAMAKKECGGMKAFKGMCFVEDGKHIFEMTKAPPPTLAKLIKVLAKQHAGLMIRPICRLKAGSETEEEDHEEEHDEDAVDEVAPTGSGPDPAMAKYNAEIKSLASDLKQVLTMEGDAAEAVSKQFVVARAAAKNNLYVEALKELSVLRPLLAKAMKAAAEEQEQEEEEEEGDDGGEFGEMGDMWHERRAGLMISLKQVKDVDPATFDLLKGPFQEAVALAGGNKFSEALQRLEASDIDAQIARALQAGRVAEAESVRVGTVEFGKALFTWRQTLSAASGEIARLQSKIRSSYPQNADLAEELNKSLSEFQGGLLGILDEGKASKSDEDWASCKRAAAKTVKKFRALLGTNEVIPILDRCPFAQMSLRGTLLDGLAEVQATLKA